MIKWKLKKGTVSASKQKILYHICACMLEILNESVNVYYSDNYFVILLKLCRISCTYLFWSHSHLFPIFPLSTTAIISLYAVHSCLPTFHLGSQVSRMEYWESWVAAIEIGAAFPHSVKRERVKENKNGDWERRLSLPKWEWESWQGKWKFITTSCIHDAQKTYRDCSCIAHNND